MIQIGLKTINPKDVLLWTFRRNENDIVNLYDTLSSIMQLATENNILNFGYWGKYTQTPYQAQVALCTMISKIADLDAARSVLDIGSGFSEPAIIWKNNFPNLEIHCTNINLNQLRFASNLVKDSDPATTNGHGSINLINGNATDLPLTSNSVDRVIALESAQHFRHLKEFASQAKRILKTDGCLVMAIPVLNDQVRPGEFFRLGILSFTWSSEHYQYNEIVETMQREGFKVTDRRFIGSSVYPPLSDYYINNREELKKKILEAYPSYVERILFRSLIKMKELSQNGTIEYVVLKFNVG